MKVTPLTPTGSPMQQPSVVTHSGTMGGNPPGAMTALAAAAASAVETKPTEPAVRSDLFEIGMELPSRMCFYPFDNLGVKHFGILEHIKLRRAVTEEKLRHQVDALSACQDHSAYDLSVGDFQFLMYWHRINDFKRTPYTVDWKCQAEGHVMRADEDYAKSYAKALAKNQAAGEDADVFDLDAPLEADSLENTHVLQRSSMEVIMLDQAKCEAFMQEFEANYGFKLFPPMVKDMVFATEEDEIDPDLSAFNRYAGVLNPYVHGATLAERRHVLIQYTANNPGLDIVRDFELWVKACDHGVNETVEVTCKGCGSKRGLTLRVDPFTFFPAL